MVETMYFISEAAKEVKVENHVLRYWEEELNLPVKRNEQGHRYYTKEDIERFIYIKQLKEEGLQLKAIRMYMKDGKITERGSFDELMALGGDFAEVYNTQQAQRKSMVDFDALAAESGVR